ncbi:hypothetical protein [Paraburkholderia lacunae]|uniref:hypothetical protein n=1 Tax=Paraburkholderia lacunae TaxID=2211104 RepID=UPI00105881E9|nr:hypothetical protein [Paraburkholderia lacunae]
MTWPEEVSVPRIGRQVIRGIFLPRESGFKRAFSIHGQAIHFAGYCQRKTAIKGELFSVRLHLHRHARRVDIFLPPRGVFTHLFALNSMRREYLRRSAAARGHRPQKSNALGRRGGG